MAGTRVFILTGLGSNTNEGGNNTAASGSANPETSHISVSVAMCDTAAAVLRHLFPGAFNVHSNTAGNTNTRGQKAGLFDRLLLNHIIL